MSVLPDVLEPNLHVVFCGTAVGEASARVGEYYAGPGHQFREGPFLRVSRRRQSVVRPLIDLRQQKE